MRLTVLSLILLSGIAPVDAAHDKPNVILIVADDLGWADLGCYGSKFHRTPNLDKLAANGIRFTQAYSACPVCSPSRAAILTGKNPVRVDITDWIPGRTVLPDQKLRRPDFRSELVLNETTLAEVLKTAGYATAHIGKWHLGGVGFGPLQQGFDVNIAGDHTGTPMSYFAPFGSKNKAGQPLQMPGLEDAPDGQYLTDRLTDEAVKFISRQKEQPFFLYMPHFAVHNPMRAKPETVAKYPQAPVHGKQSNPTYAAMLESLDDCIGKLMQTLDELKLRDNTLVIFTSDNGGLATLEGANFAPTCNTPLREGKGYLYEGGIRVPLILAGATVKGGRTVSGLAVGTDLFATVCDVCGIKADRPSDSVSLKPVLEGAERSPRSSLAWHYPHYANQGGRPGGAVRDGDWKLIESYETGRRELYDVAKDVSESRNRIADEPAIAERLAKQLADWRTTVGAKMPTPNADYLPNPQRKDGAIVLAARSAFVSGIQLRFEPLPHKNTLGFWTNPSDFATWEFTVSKPGKFTVEVLQGCGTDQGGSEVVIHIGDQSVSFTVEDTGGFQAFKSRTVGTVAIPAVGRHNLKLSAKTKAKAAVGDFREITLKPR